MPAGILPAGPASRPQAHVTPFPAPRDTAAAALVLFFVKFLLDISQIFPDSKHHFAKNAVRCIQGAANGEGSVQPRGVLLEAKEQVLPAVAVG